MKIDFGGWELKMLYHLVVREIALHDIENWNTQDEADEHLRQMERLENRLRDSWK